MAASSVCQKLGRGFRPTLRDLLLYTRDGEWGKSRPEPGLVAARILRGTDFPEARLGDPTNAPIRYLPRDIVARKALRPGDILIETAGGSESRPTGRTLLITPRLLDASPIPTLCASFARFLRVDGARAHAPYLYWFLQYLYATGQIEQHQVQHTGVARFQFTRFAEALRLRLPPPGAQRSIARTLSAIDDKIELNRRMSKTLESMARALYKSWFIDFDPVRKAARHLLPIGPEEPPQALFPTELVDSALGPIPKGWTVRPIGDVARLVGGGTPRTAEPSYWTGGTIAWATPKDLSALAAPVLLDTHRRITEAGLSQISSGLLPRQTVLLSSRAPIGYVAVADVPVAINQGFIAIPPGGALNPAFVLFWLLHNLEKIRARAGGTTFAEISKADLRPIPLAVPSPEILDRFAAVATPLLAQITANQRESMKLTRIRDSLLPRLLSGELAPPAL